MMHLDRRKFIAGATLAAASLALPGLAVAAPQATHRSRRLYLTSIHTGESLEVSHGSSPSYLEELARALRHFGRDHRTGEEHDIDLTLLDQLARIAEDEQVSPEFEVISGYRSPRTNASLPGTARRSLHMEGRALDIRHRALGTGRLARAALALRAGGVGSYPRDAFVHIDTGAVRSW